MSAHRSGFPLSARSAERSELKWFALAATFFLLLAPVAWMTGAKLWLVLIFFIIAAVIAADYGLAVLQLKQEGVGSLDPEGDPMGDPDVVARELSENERHSL